MRRLAIPVVLTLGGIVWAAVHWATHQTVGAQAVTETHGSHGSQPAGSVGVGYLSTSLTLCLSLALVLAATVTFETRRRSMPGRSLWLFGIVPVLGLLVEALAVAPRTPSAVASGLLELAPLALVSLVVQICVALVALRLAHRILGLAESLVRAFVISSVAPRDPGERSFPRERSDRAPSSRLSLGGSQRAPPAALPAF